MQLVAYGAQDIYLTGNPQITFFKVVYRRHTNFSMECIQQTFKGTCESGARVVATVSRNGDLIHDCFLKIIANGGDTVDTHNTAMNPGHYILDNVEVEIGGQMIDRQYGHFMEAHAQLTEPSYGGFVENAADTVSIGSSVIVFKVNHRVEVEVSCCTISINWFLSSHYSFCIISFT